MISESQYWKSDLRKNLEFIFNKLDQKVWRTASFVALEKKLMLSSYIVRKLFESNKISEELYEKPIRLYSYKTKGIPVGVLNSHKIEQLYEIDTPQQMTKNLSYVLNQIIHSYIFTFTFESKNSIHGIIFNSDKSKRKVLYMLPLQDFLDALFPIADFYISKSICEINEHGELVVVSSE
tara:strand:+ start:67 stop:603 length:537 start_codon:yes stop_codon:yes gene_type:complete